MEFFSLDITIALVPIFSCSVDFIIHSPYPPLCGVNDMFTHLGIRSSSPR